MLAQRTQSSGLTRAYVPVPCHSARWPCTRAVHPRGTASARLRCRSGPSNSDSPQQLPSDFQTLTATLLASQQRLEEAMQRELKELRVSHEASQQASQQELQELRVSHEASQQRLEQAVKELGRQQSRMASQQSTMASQQSSMASQQGRLFEYAIRLQVREAEGSFARAGGPLVITSLAEVAERVASAAKQHDSLPPSRANFMSEEVLRALAKALLPHARTFARGIATALQTAQPGPGDDVDEMLRALRDAYAAHPFGSSRGKVDTHELAACAGMMPKDLGLTTTLLAIRNVLAAKRAGKKLELLHGSLGLVLALHVSSGQHLLWPFARQPKGMAPPLVTSLDDVPQGQDELEMNVRGRIMVTKREAILHVGEIKSTADELPKAKTQLQRILSLFSWAIRTAAKQPNLPIGTSATLYIPTLAVKRGWPGVQDLPDKSPLFIHPV